MSFWERAYEVEQNTQGPVLPQLRVGDTELGPLLTGTLGVGFRVGDPTMGLTLSTDAMYTRFLDHLYLKTRVAGFGAVAFDVEVD